jgi:hypothetical protein
VWLFYEKKEKKSHDTVPLTSTAQLKVWIYRFLNVRQKKYDGTLLETSDNNINYVQYK